jgi:hypothetical protein
VLNTRSFATAADQRRQFVGELWGVAEAEGLRRDAQTGGVCEVLDEDGERRPVRRWHFVRLATPDARATEHARTLGGDSLGAHGRGSAIDPVGSWRWCVSSTGIGLGRHSASHRPTRTRRARGCGQSRSVRMIDSSPMPVWGAEGMWAAPSAMASGGRRPRSGHRRGRSSRCAPVQACFRWTDVCVAWRLDFGQSSFRRIREGGSRVSYGGVARAGPAPSCLGSGAMSGLLRPVGPEPGQT